MDDKQKENYLIVYVTQQVSIHPHPIIHIQVWLQSSSTSFFFKQQPGPEIIRILSTLLSRPATPDPAFALLNHCLPDLTKAQSKLAICIITASKQTIARAWKSSSFCSVETKNGVTKAMIHSKMEATNLDKIPRHLKIWYPWVDHFLPPCFKTRLLEP